MIILLAIFSFIFGLIIGSFLNVVILRYNTGRSINGRSACMHCGYQLKWFDLVPLFSWVGQKGRCRQCKSKISIQYPLVELATGLIFLALFLMVWPLREYFAVATTLFVFNAIIFSILIVIFVYDLRHKIIPNNLVYIFAGLALLKALWLMPINEIFALTNILNILAGPIFFLPFFALRFFSQGRWIGLGDGKLALGIGWFLGFVNGLSAIVLAFWIGAIIAIGLLLIERLKQSSQNITMKTEIPFAPFLIVGLLIEFFWQIDVVGISLFL